MPVNDHHGVLNIRIRVPVNFRHVEGRRDGRFTRYRVADPRVADLVVLARSMAADNAAALAACVHIAPASDGEAGP